MLKKNLKYYRLKKNMTKKALATACGISPMAITNYENGDRTPDMDTLYKLARILEVGVADFIVSRKETLSFVHGEFRKTSAFSQTKQEFVRESVEEYFNRFFCAVDCLGGNPLPKPFPTHCLISTGDYSKDAIALREKIGFYKEGPVDELITHLENLGILVVLLDIDDSHFSGINGTVNEYPYIAINKAITTERMRTTIVHELTHMMFKSLRSNNEESYATAVSGAFLITDVDVARELGIRRTRITKDMDMVCEEYGIAMSLLVKRAEQVGVISKHVAQAYYIKVSKSGLRTCETKAGITPERPTLFEQLVYRAINEEDISIYKGAELLGLPYNQVESHCGLVEV